MRRESKSLLVGRLALTLVVASAAVVMPIPPLARAQTAADSPVTVTDPAWDEAGAGDAEIERWWGVAGAVLCGAEIRLIRYAPAIGMNPYAIAAGLSGCLLAMLDVMTTE